jgi:hypothetical protein
LIKKKPNVFWVPESTSCEAMRAAAKQPGISKRIEDALIVIETENGNPKLKGILDNFLDIYRYGHLLCPLFFTHSLNMFILSIKPAHHVGLRRPTPAG